MPTRTTGGARFFTEQMLGGPCREAESNPTCATSATSLCNNSPDRVGLVIVNQGANDVFIALNTGVSTSNGIRLSANGGNVTMTVRDDFTMPSRQWFGLANGGSSAVYVLEEIQDITLQPEQA